MSDNPTLYVELYCGYEHEGMRFGCTTREAYRADLLAALDGKWWCCIGMDVMTETECMPDDVREGSAHADCHWAVKP